jgi:hypothetical protein
MTACRERAQLGDGTVLASHAEGMLAVMDDARVRAGDRRDVTSLLRRTSTMPAAGMRSTMEDFSLIVGSFFNRGLAGFFRYQ